MTAAWAELAEIGFGAAFAFAIWFMWAVSKEEEYK